MFDGTRARGGVISPWSQRRVAAASLISSVNPDVVGVQEANDWAGKNYRQVDSLRSALAGVGRNYTVAHTEALVTEPEYRANGYLRTGNYILYKPSVYRAVGLGGSWQIGTKVYAVYQVLQNISSGAKVLVVNTHLTQPGGRANDLARASQTRAMIARGASAHLPVVYVGDYNSNTNPKQYTLDGPGDTMRAAHIADARLVAQSRINPHYDSANNYMRAPFHYDLYIDYLWLSAGVSASQWGMAMRLSHGRLVGVIPSDHNPIWAQLRYSY
jgi:endonuclease/exonuclease/phosphatase family metal-dependent hydrolase